MNIPLLAIIIIVAGVALAVYFLASHPKLAEAAKILYWTALATLFYLLVK